MDEELHPEPVKLKRKPRGPRIEDLVPPDCSLQPTDLSKTQCCGVLNGEGVAITAPQHMWALVKLGSYGKGVFSRGIPCHQHIPSLSEMKQAIRKRKGGGGSCEEVEESWRKRIKLHSQWKEADRGQLNETGKSDEKGGASTDGGQSEMGKVDDKGGTNREEAGKKGIKDMEAEDYQSFVERLLAIKSEDPYHMDEYLQLGREEAFYLAAKAKVLSVVNSEAVTLSEDQLWAHFARGSSSFPVRYAAYAHYRTGNWVPKSGLKYGVDFLLYKESPLAYHSSFSVVVREEEEAEDTKCGTKRGDLTWREVIAQDRVSESALKDLLICHVTKPGGVSEETLRQSCCAETMVVRDTMVKHWIPERDRESD